MIKKVCSILEGNYDEIINSLTREKTNIKMKIEAIIPITNAGLEMINAITIQMNPPIPSKVLLLPISSFQLKSL